MNLDLGSSSLSYWNFSSACFSILPTASFLNTVLWEKDLTLRPIQEMGLCSFLGTGSNENNPVLTCVAVNTYQNFTYAGEEAYL